MKRTREALGEDGALYRWTDDDGQPDRFGSMTREQLLAEVRRLDALVNNPAVGDFVDAVQREAAHQRLRWGSAHDASKSPEAWYWTLGHLAGKGLAAWRQQDLDKAAHHCVSSAALLAHWHAHVREAAALARADVAYALRRADVDAGGAP